MCLEVVPDDDFVVVVVTWYRVVFNIMKDLIDESVENKLVHIISCNTKPFSRTLETSIEMWRNVRISRFNSYYHVYFGFVTSVEWRVLHSASSTLASVAGCTCFQVKTCFVNVYKTVYWFVVYTKGRWQGLVPNQ